MWIAAEFAWKCLNGTTFDTLNQTIINQTPNIDRNASPQTNSHKYKWNKVAPQLLAGFDTELQLTKCLTPDDSDPEGELPLNEH